jgi:hypothetical protein
VIARATALALAAVTAGGCLRNVPKSETRSLGRTVSPPVVASIQPLEVGTRVAGAVAIVTVRWRRECRRDVIQTTETSEWESIVSWA